MSGPRAQIVNDSFSLRLALLYAALFLAAGWYLPFFPVWLAARGLDPGAIGVVLAAFQFTRIAGTPAGTRLSDRYGAPKNAIVLASCATVVAMLVIANVSGFVAIAIAAILYSLTTAPLMPLTDAYALKGLDMRKRAYGPVRLWGSVSFVVANVTGGMLLGVLAPGNLIWLIFTGSCLVAIASFAIVPLPRESAPQRGAAGHSHLRRPAFLAMMVAASLVQASHAVYYGFSTIDWRAQGLSGTTIGLLWGIGVVAEVALFAASARVRLPAPALMIAFGAAGAVVRWLAMALDPPAALLPALQVLHAASFGATHLGTMAYLARAAPEGGRGAAQGDVAAANGVAMAAATALSGALYQSYGGAAYAAMAVMAVIGGVAAMVARRLSS